MPLNNTPELRAKAAARNRARRARNPEASRREGRDWRERNKKKYFVQRRVKWAVAGGRLSRQPCEVCGAERSNAHHDDYDRPLDVRWLCNVHHAAWHAANGEGANAHTPMIRRQKASAYRGVYRCKDKFRAQLDCNRKTYQSPPMSEVEAAHAYDRLARDLFGDKAILNFPNEQKRSA